MKDKFMMATVPCTQICITHSNDLYKDKNEQYLQKGRMVASKLVYGNDDAPEFCDGQPVV